VKIEGFLPLGVRMIRIVIDTVIIVLALVGAHTVLNTVSDWAVRRGWLVDLKTKRPGSAFGNAMLHVEGILDPGKRAVIVAKQHVGEQQVADGEPEDSVGKKVYFELKP
jgi:hypothetical protein